MGTSRIILQCAIAFLSFSFTGLALGAEVTDLPPTAEELADPPPGEIRKLYLREVNEVRSQVQATVDQVSSDQRNLPIFVTLQSVMNGLNRLATSRQQSALFALIPAMAQVFQAFRKDDAPDFVHDARNSLENLGALILKTMAAHIKERQGEVDVETVRKFVTAFSVRGFSHAYDWEDEDCPIDGTGIMILNPAAVVAFLKTRPVEEAERYIGRATVSQFFGRYKGDEDGMPILKTRYTQNKQAIEAKFTELVTWVAQPR